MAPNWHPWRRNMEFTEVHETPIRPLLDDLSFVIDKTHWGYMFRLGLFEIPEADFELVRDAMID